MKTIILGLGMVLVGLTNAVGQTITQAEINKMTKGVPFKRFTKYIDSNGNEYNVGDTLTVGNGSNNGRYVHVASMMFDGTPIVVSPSWVGANTIIKRMMIVGNRRVGFKLTIQSKGVLSKLYFNLNDAINSGEIIGNGYTSDMALAELKKCKDKLDLGLITQEEFNKKRAELSKYIK